MPNDYITNPVALAKLTSARTLAYYVSQVFAPLGGNITAAALVNARTMLTDALRAVKEAEQVLEAEQIVNDKASAKIAENVEQGKWPSMGRGWQDSAEQPE